MKKSTLFLSECGFFGFIGFGGFCSQKKSTEANKSKKATFRQSIKRINHPFHRLKIVCFLVFWMRFGCITTANAQPMPKEHNTIFLNVAYSAQLPAGDLANRFGWSMSTGASIEYFLTHKNWIIGTEAYYLFGQTVKEDVLAFARTTEGAILGDIGNYAQVDLRERGFYWGGHIGRFFKMRERGNLISGLRVTLGAGFLQHYIRIQDNQNVSIPQLTGVYRAGYDRLTNGLAFNQFIGWQVLSRNKRIHFHIGLEWTEGFTQNRRGFNFDTGLRDDKNRLDRLGALKLGWMLPVWNAQKASEIEY
jgi:hypothetical protein